MRILHTSDWHIGKRLDQRPRLEEHRAVLKEVVTVAKENSVDLVLIAGDVYDTFIPTAEGEGLFYDVLSDLSTAGITTLVISGNHDDQQRLIAARALAERTGAYFADPSFEGFYPEKKGNLTLVTGGGDYFIFEKEGERVYFATLPYPTELRMREKVVEGESYEDKVKRYIKKATEKAGDLPVILVGHVFMLGGMKTEGERNIELGGARILPPSVIPDNCIYTALGHLHKRQVVSGERNILYSGSIMQFSFDEAGYEKSVTVFDVTGGKVQNLKTVKLRSYKELYNVTASSVEEAEEKISHLDGYVQLTLNLDGPLDGAVLKSFLNAHDNVVLKMVFSGVEGSVTLRRDLDDQSLFKEYYKARFGGEPSADVLELYLRLIGEEEVCNEA